MKSFGTFLTESREFSLGFIDPSGRDIPAASTGGMLGGPEDHTDVARRIEGNDGGSVNALLRKGYVRYWLRNGEVDLNLIAGNNTACSNALRFLKDHYTNGDRVYLDVLSGAPNGFKPFADTLSQANAAIRSLMR